MSQYTPSPYQPVPSPAGGPGGSTPAPWTHRSTPTVAESVFFVGGWLALLWILEVIDLITLGSLDAWGVSPRDVTELPQVLTAPFVHYGFAHLAANSLPFLVLGVLVRLSGRREFWVATGWSIVVSGLTAWLLSAPFTVTGGASGLIFGWLVYLIVRGLFTGNWMQILIGAAVFGFFGGMLWGVLPTLPGVSWQAHLGGAAGGAIAAWWLRRR